MLAVIASMVSVFLPLRVPGTKQNVAIYTSEVCVLHNPGPRHPECPARLARLRQALNDDWLPEFGENILVCEPDVDVTRDYALATSPSLPAHRWLALCLTTVPACIFGRCASSWRAA